MNKNEKNVVLFLLSVFLLVVIFVPLKVQAKTFVIGSSIYSAWQDDFDIIEPGDILDFSNCSSSIKYDLFLDGEKESECYGNKPECNKTQYIVKDRMVFGYAEYEYQHFGGKTAEEESRHYRYQSSSVYHHHRILYYVCLRGDLSEKRFHQAPVFPAYLK